jgi:glycosyltransferase involved in cell wall biosynthesis
MIDKVAALIPAYNEEYCLPLCLLSIVPFVHEIVVLDDCSTDGTEGFLADLKREIVLYPPPHFERKTRIYRTEKQVGWVEVRNRLLRMTECRWVIFIDADDVLHEKAGPLLERAIREMQEPICMIPLTELWGDLRHTTGRLHRFDRCHNVIDRARVGDVRWIQEEQGWDGHLDVRVRTVMEPGDGWGKLGIWPCFFHLKGVKPDRRIVERHYMRGWLKSKQRKGISDWIEMSPERIHEEALSILIGNSGNDLIPIEKVAGMPELPIILKEQEAQRLMMVYRDGKPVDRIDREEMVR